jgi:hypothetical protein
VAESQANHWNPAKTHLFVLGVLNYVDSEHFRGFPASERRDDELVSLLAGRGVAPSRTCVLQDQGATLKAAREGLQRLGGQAAPDDLLVFYFAGYGTKNRSGEFFLAPHDAKAANLEETAWKASSLFQDLESFFPGSKVLIFADCGASGALALEAEKRSHDSRQSYAVLTSALVNGGSSVRWTFTEALLAGFSGSSWADLDKDESISLKDLAGFTREELAFAEQIFPAFYTSPGFDKDLILSASHPAKYPKVGHRLEAPWQDQWWKARVVDIDSDNQLWKVHFLGWKSKWDAWVNPKTLREVERKSYLIGTKIFVLWKGRPYPAHVLRQELGLHLVHYEGWDSKWDEWVGPGRIKE